MENQTNAGIHNYDGVCAERGGRGDQEAHEMDADSIRTLRYGMQSTAGEGIGIDRLTMVLTDSSSIRDAILFPLLRSEPPVEHSEFQNFHMSSADGCIDIPEWL